MKIAGNGQGKILSTDELKLLFTEVLKKKKAVSSIGF